MALPLEMLSRETLSREMPSLEMTMEQGAGWEKQQLRLVRYQAPGRMPGVSRPRRPQDPAGELAEEASAPGGLWLWP